MGRKWGQHFLRSQTTVNRILDAAEIGSEDVVVEIGPGEGVLTLPLCTRAGQVHAFEIDPELAHQLEKREIANLTVHRGDFLKAEVAEGLGPLPDGGVTVVANLPYYITAPIVERLFWQRPLPIKRAILMMQDEVAQRICSPSTRQAGALTYIAGAFYDCEMLFGVPPGCFSPPPKVESAVIRLTPREQSADQQLSAVYERLVSAAFNARRKQLARSLKLLSPQARELLEQAGLSPERRPETFTVQEFWHLARNWQHRE